MALGLHYASLHAAPEPSVKGKNMYRAAFIALAFLLSGCVGLAVGTYGKKELARTDFNLANKRNQFSFEKSDSYYTEKQIIEYWGDPDSVDNFKECTVLIYKDGTSWAGAGAFIGVVPVPLAVPTGSYKNRFYIRNNLAIGLIQEYGEVDRSIGYSCGSNECGASSGEKVNEPQVNAKEAVKEWCSKSN